MTKIEDKIALLTGEIFDHAFEEYKDECIGISASVCDSYYRPGELEEKYKNAARWLVRKILDEYEKKTTIKVTDILDPGER